MASSSGKSSVSSVLQNSGSESDHQRHLIDERKRKRKLSNRESARRSRMRKQKHLDDLTAQVARLGKENGQIVTSIAVTTQQYVSLEAENKILRAQLMELSLRLRSLMGFLNIIENNNFNGGHDNDDDDDHHHHHHHDHNNNHRAFEGMEMETGQGVFDGFMNPFNLGFINQPIMANADIFQY